MSVKFFVTFVETLLLLAACAVLGCTAVFRPDLFLAVFVGVCIFGLVGNLIVAVASILYRRRHGKYILTPSFDNALFTERQVSARADRGLALFQAVQVCWLAVVPDRLLVGPMFPMTLWFFPERNGMEYDLAAEEILDVRVTASKFGRSKVRVEFRPKDGTENRHLDLRVRNPDGFISALTSIVPNVASNS